MEKDILQEELRKRHLNHLITEAVILALYEQDQMQQIPQSPPAANAPPTPQEVQQMGTPPVEQQVPPVAPPPQVLAEQITMDMLIERLNIIRGGKSFTDPEVYGQMTTYFKSMPSQDREVIYKYLLQVSKIATSNTSEQTGEVEQQTPAYAQPEVQSTPPQPVPQPVQVQSPAPQQTAPIQAQPVI